MKKNIKDLHSDDVVKYCHYCGNKKYEYLIWRRKECCVKCWNQKHDEKYLFE